ncbi:MAG: rRNA pseudouridine synthase [Candidatus Eremiobacteraeota bacterium]|nr:rRNA pseudouridine synthase [Candidatus Eremiobacteraeota bacterium]
MRLQKFLAQGGVASRRKAEEFITAGRVRVNGTVVRELGTTVAPNDRVEVDGKRISLAADFTYLILNKPPSIMTTMRDPEGRRTIVDILPKNGPRIVPVGRLDYDTSGVLLLTNDGDLAHVLTHPRFGVEKTYRAVVSGRLSQADVAALQKGVRLEEFRASGAYLRVVATRGDSSVVDLTIHEGKYRQVRRMFETLGHPVLTLERLRFGPLSLGALKSGQTRPITDRELAALRVVASQAEATKAELAEVEPPKSVPKKPSSRRIQP